MSPLLKDKLAIVTGSNRGIGLEILRLFAEHGAHLIACARKPSDTFAALCEELASQHRTEVIPLYFDLAKPDEIKAALNQVVAMRRSVDVLVNNAGIASGALFQMTSMQTLRDTFEVNFFGQIQLTQTISRLMSRQRSGSIVNMASVAALHGQVGMMAYGSSKAAMTHATRVLANELGIQGVRVNAIAPNATQTDMLAQMEAGAREQLLQSCALKRAAQPREIANVALFLASDLSSYITGQVLEVDGGLT
jgi:3-oxoacyl-[acyl-carrier protein] reductase